MLVYSTNKHYDLSSSWLLLSSHRHANYDTDGYIRNYAGTVSISPIMPFP